MRGVCLFSNRLNEFFARSDFPLVPKISILTHLVKLNYCSLVNEKVVVVVVVVVAVVVVTATVIVIIISN